MADFILHKPYCPTCGKPANRILEIINCLTPIRRAEDCQFDYQSGTTPLWNSQHPKLNADDEAIVFCNQNHLWFTTFE